MRLGRLLLSLRLGRLYLSLSLGRPAIGFRIFRPSASTQVLSRTLPDMCPMFAGLIGLNPLFS